MTHRNNNDNNNNNQHEEHNEYIKSQEKTTAGPVNDKAPSNYQNQQIRVIKTKFQNKKYIQNSKTKNTYKYTNEKIHIQNCKSKIKTFNITNISN